MLIADTDGPVTFSSREQRGLEVCKLFEILYELKECFIDTPRKVMKTTLNHHIFTSTPVWYGAMRTTVLRLPHILVQYVHELFLIPLVCNSSFFLRPFLILDSYYFLITTQHIFLKMNLNEYYSYLLWFTSTFTFCQNLIQQVLSAIYHVRCSIWFSVLPCVPGHPLRSTLLVQVVQLV